MKTYVKPSLELDAILSEDIMTLSGNFDSRVGKVKDITGPGEPPRAGVNVGDLLDPND